jgi:hypothetical protein
LFSFFPTFPPFFFPGYSSVHLDTEADSSPIHQQVEVWMRPLTASDGSFNNDLIEMMKVMALAVRQVNKKPYILDE